jgi:hypothetical protein
VEPSVTGRDEKQDLAGEDILLEVNAHVHEAATRFERSGPAHDHWAFTCECGSPGCRATASLTLAEYESLRAAGRPVLADGHEKPTA